ncbi:MAG: prolyl oligopeptidase family serine peptidase [Flavobacteriaceae bacterium]|nr:prolyl oligopeptidase family serine peptidase [Flavobacteriaceae bacterium]
MKYLNLIFVFIFVSQLSQAQEKKVLSHNDYDLWKSISKYDVSEDGAYLVTEAKTTTNRGNGFLQLNNLLTHQATSFPRGTQGKLTHNQNYLVYLVKPDYDTLRNQKKEEIKKEKQAKNQLRVFSVETGELVLEVDRVKKYYLPKENSDFLVIEKHKNLPEEDKNEENSSQKSKKKKNKAQNKTNQKQAVEKQDYALVYAFATKELDTLVNFKNLALPEKASHFYYTTINQKEKEDLGVYKYDVSTLSSKLMDASFGDYAQLATSKDGQHFAFVAARMQKEKDSLNYGLFYFDQERIHMLVDTIANQLQDGWQISKYQKPMFSENNQRLFYYAQPKIEYQIDTTLLKEEIPDVDVWTYTDGMIQPEQKAKEKQLLQKAYVGYFDLNSFKKVDLQPAHLENIDLGRTKETQNAIASTNNDYELSRSWEYPWKRDFYVVHTETGEHELIIKGKTNYLYANDEMNFAVFYDFDKLNWYSINLLTKEISPLTEALPVAFYNEENDVPASASAYGFGGYLNANEVILYDEFDVWKFDLNLINPPEKLTNGREDQIQYRAFRLDPEKRQMASYYKEELLLSGFHKYNKTNGLFSLSQEGSLNVLISMQDHLISGIKKAEKAETLVYRKQDFQNYPDVFHLSKNEDHQITQLNSQKEDFYWGEVNLISWRAYDDEELQGLLYMPEDFDASKKYPMITYFYEKRSDNFHRYISPQPSASIVNISYLVSNGYVAFVPDIVYQKGDPGKSAENCVLSGVDYVIENYNFIDETKMAIQGQSWGGYQVAHLITKTNRFAAAGSGAPVSNMTSAYGGIRWQSGLSRQFQYEKTQSRIGATLWEDLPAYLRNSPLFGVPEVETPVLIMHNDKDGAVPYYQGIEFFMGLRRLEKPAWLLVYNNEAHNLRKVKNKQDLSIRMMQFFDHFLKDEPLPIWMKDGIPRVKKAKDLGYDLIED